MVVREGQGKVWDFLDGAVAEIGMFCVAVSSTTKDIHELEHAGDSRGPLYL